MSGSGRFNYHCNSYELEACLICSYLNKMASVSANVKKLRKSSKCSA